MKGPQTIQVSGRCWMLVLSYRIRYNLKPNTAQPKLSLLGLVLPIEMKESSQRQYEMEAHSSKWSMSNNNIDIQQASDSSEGSSVDVRIIPVNERSGKTEASSSDSEPSCSSSERQRRCIIEVRVETPLSGSWNQAKGVTVCILQSNLHRVWIYIPEDIEQRQESCNPNEDSMRVWSPENCIPWKFEIEIQEHETKNPLKRPTSRPGSPQQEAGGPRKASRRLNR